MKTIEQIATEKSFRLLEDVAAATQDRRFLLDAPECDRVLCDAILRNGSKIIFAAIKEATTAPRFPERWKGKK